MIETEQAVVVNVPIDGVWEFTREIARWSELMPGIQTFREIDTDNSHWVLKVGAGGMVRVVNVLVRVDEWCGPERVLFSFNLDADPVVGSGAYVASRTDDGQTEVRLRIRVEGSGPMAPMWEAMSRPLLPTLAQGFARKLKTRIEAETPGAAVAGRPAEAPVSGLGAVIVWLRRLWRRIAGGRT